MEKVSQKLGKECTLGIMVNWLGDPYVVGILTGAMDVAANAGASLLCFVGGHLPLDPSTNARHRIFDLVGTNNVGGVVMITSTLMNQVGRAGVESFCKKHCPELPKYSVGVELSGIPSLVLQNEKGIKKVMQHLVTEHHFRRIAFVRGPLVNDEAEARYQAYVNSLRDLEIPFDQRLVSTGDFLEASGHAAVNTFSRCSGMKLEDLDAIVSSNDIMAIGVLSALEERRISVPATIAITGFDDIEEARLTSSPLTTVKQPLEKLGQQAIRNLLQWRALGKPPENTALETELIVRSSCSCSKNQSKFKPSVVPELNQSFDAALICKRQQILDRLTRTARGELGGLGADWQNRLLTALVAESRGDEPGAFSNLIEEFAQKLMARGTDLQVCHDLVDVLRKQLAVAMRSDPIRRDRTEDAFHQSHLVLSSGLQRNLMRDRLRLGRWVREISSACTTLSSTFEKSELRTLIRELLPRVGLRNYFVVTYSEAPEAHRACLFVGSDQGRDVGDALDQTFDAAQLLPRHLLSVLSSGRAFSVLPLTCSNANLGHIILELNLEHSFSYGAIAEAIGVGLYGVRFALKTSL
jgi:DNA-binding LacI/PurR family transcriptional regulator